MFRKRLLIRRDALPQWFLDPKLVKIELAVSRNAKLTNEAICEIYAYFKLDDNTVNQICGLCSAFAKTSGITPAEHAFLNGIQFQKNVGFINTSMVKKINEISEKYKINLGITNQINDLLKKYADGKQI